MGKQTLQAKYRRSTSALDVAMSISSESPGRSKVTVDPNTRHKDLTGIVNGLGKKFPSLSGLIPNSTRDER
jgi:hypothetical protein